MKAHYIYSIEYRLYKNDEIKRIAICAGNKEEAYRKAVYKEIPIIEEQLPYSAWVASVTYNNGNYRTFNTFEGKPY